jgi:eukaryotic-like serine/threonine-protein kinase
MNAIVKILKWCSVLAFMACLAGLALVYFGLAVQEFFQGEEVIIPDFTGNTLTYALEKKPAGVDLQIMEKKMSLRYEANVVIDQTPIAGTRVKQGRQVFLVVSLGSHLKEVVQVKGVSLRRARLLLRGQGFHVGKISTLFKGHENQGKVLAQSPEEGSFVREGEAVSLLVGAALAEAGRIPRYQGRLLSEARTHALSFGWELAPLHFSWDPIRSENEILAQEPVPGAVAETGLRKIALWVNQRRTHGQSGGQVLKQRIEIRLPGGLKSKDLKVELVDFNGSRELHHRRHQPEALFFLDIEYQGTGYLNLFLDGLLYKKMELLGDENVFNGR